MKEHRFPDRNNGRRWPRSLTVLSLSVTIAATFFWTALARAADEVVTLVPANFTALAEKVRPAVVNIRTVKTVDGAERMFRHFQRGPGGQEDPFGEFFDRFFGDGQQRRFKQRSLGSGFIIDSKGYVVTNNHVIEAADQIKVKLNDGKEYEATVVGRDPNTDLALIRLTNAEGLPSIPLGDSDTIKVGEWVVAIGSPFGLEHTVTAGIVSAKGRVIGSGPYDDYLQTDASINPGNSGGPLINMQGEVVGINTAIIASGQGIGFAIPINLARGIIDQLKTEGAVTRGWLGVAIQDLTPEMAEYYGVEEKSGVLVTEAFEGDPAQKAGIRAKDIIVEIEGQAIDSSRDLTGRVANIRPGEKIKVTVIRDGKRQRFAVEIAKRQEDRLAGGPASAQPADDLGMRVTALTDETAEPFNLKETEGVLVADVDPEGRAAEAGVRPGDVIKEINHRPTHSVADYQAAIRATAEEGEFQLFIWREGTGFLVIKIDKPK